MDAQNRVLPPRGAEASGGQVKGVLSTTEERVSEILAATERAAAAIVEAANAEAEQIVRARRTPGRRTWLSRGSSGSTRWPRRCWRRRARSKVRSNGLRDLIYKSIERLAEELRIEVRTTEPATPPVAEEPRPSANGSRLSDDMRASAKRDRSAAVRLLATQMIAAGHTRDEAERRLREEFGVKDPAAALDSIGIHAGHQR